MTVSEIVASRLRLMGTSQAQIAREVGTNPTQMGVFLKGQGTLSSEVLERCLQKVGIDLTIYENRNSSAVHVADILIGKGITQIDNLSKEDIIYLTGMYKLRALFDVDSVDTYYEILKSGLVDVESTFPYFKALVAYIFNIQNTEYRKKQIESRKKQICNDIDDIDKRLDKITSSAAKSSLRGIFFRAKEREEMEYRKREEQKEKYKKEKELRALEEEGYMMESKSQKGSIYLFSKNDFFSLNEKAIDYIRKGQV